MKKLMALLLALCMVLALAACGNTQTSTPAASTNDNTGSTPVENTGASKEEPRVAELNIMMSFPQYMDQWETYCKQFEAKMLAEENIKVTVNLEMPSSDQYESILQARLTGDDAPDLYTLHCNNIGTYNKAGNLYDLSDQPLADVIYENVKDTCSVDGHLMAVPIVIGLWLSVRKEEVAARIHNVLKRLAFPLLILLATVFFFSHQDTIIREFPSLGASVSVLILAAMMGGVLLSWLMRLTGRERRTIVIEVGMQNAAQSITVACSPLVFNNDIIAIPAIIYALLMNVILLTYVGVLSLKNTAK